MTEKENVADIGAWLAAIIVLVVLLVFGNAFITSVTGSKGIFCYIEDFIKYQNNYTGQDSGKIFIKSNVPSLYMDIKDRNSTGTVIVHKGIDEYMDYVLINGIEGEDYITYQLSPQPSIKYNNKDDNNEKIIRPYIKTNILTFNLPYTDKEGYIAFITNKKLADNRDLLLGINGVVVGPIRKNKSMSNRDNIYLYKLNNVVIAGTNGKGRNLYGDVVNGVLHVNAYAGEAGNYVEKIIIFFK